MQYSNGIRRTVLAMVAASAAVMVAGCQSGGGSADAAGSPSGATSASDAPTGSTPSASAPSASAPSASAPSGSTDSPVSAVPAASASSGTGTGTGSSGGAVKTCAAGSVKAAAYQAADRPDGTGTGAAVVEFTNVSSHPCVLKGHPS